MVKDKVEKKLKLSKNEKLLREKHQEHADELLRAKTKDDEDLEIFLSGRKTIRELIAPIGVNPNPLDYMVIDDNGEQLYTMCFYIHKLPTNATFAATFASILNFPNVTSSIFIDPMVAGKSAKQLDKRVVMLDTERVSAEKIGDRNQHRKILAKLRDAESWASDVESGDNLLFEVAFLFTLQATNLEELRLMASNFHMRAREKGIELCACYGVHPEAFLSGYPTNRIFTASYGIAKTSVIKKHVFDKGSLATIFNHTRSDFTHRSGIIAGRNMLTGQPVFFNIYDESHNGYGLVIVGKTGTGKSATVKMFLSRYIDFDYRIRSIDFEARGTMGEYAPMALKVGGVNYQIKANSPNVLNIFELDVEKEFDEVTETEYETLHLAEKISDTLNIIVTLITNGRELSDLTESIFLEKIVGDSIAQLYAQRGILDLEPESLYEKGSYVLNGKLTSGKVKKELPTLRDFLKVVLEKQKEDRASGNDGFYNRVYQVIIDAIKDYVKELYYCPDCLKFYTKEEYLELHAEGYKRYCTCKGNASRQIVEVKGRRAYFDGQSTIQADSDTPHINLDISQLPEADRMVALLVALSFMQENYVKKNSINPKNTKKLVVLIDELHKTFPYEKARRFIGDFYRTARKRNVSPWVSCQALSDFKGFRETEGILKNTTSLLILKQDFQDRDFIKSATPLTDSQVEQVLNLGGDPNDEEESSARKGEVCLIDNGRVVFLKVDYLTDTESYIVETDSSKIEKMYKGARLNA